MKKVDMHIHSRVSDGSNTMSEIVEMAEKKNLDGIIFTEHDTLSHLKKLPDSKKVKVMGGLEISAHNYDKDLRVHILGYNIKDVELVEKLVHPTLLARHENSLKQIKKLQEAGFDIDESLVDKADGHYIYKQHIMDYLLKTGQVDELFGDFYYKTFKNNGICHFDITYVNPIEAIRTIKEAGGLAVLAHSGQQQNFCFIDSFAKEGLDGLELNHHSNSAKDMEIIKEYATKYNLFLTGGSDHHGRYEAGSPDVGDYLAEQSGVEKIFEQ